jgi:hypothetical protein
MIRDTLTLCSIASTLLKCIQDTENVRGQRGGLALSREIKTTYGIAVYVSVDMTYGWDDAYGNNRSSISIEIDNKSIFKIYFKYIDDDWKLVTFNDDRKRKTQRKLNAASEALVKLMMDMVHASSIHFSTTN